MQRLLFFLIPTLLTIAQSQAQPKPPRPVALPDMSKLMKMSPEEQKKYAAQLQKELSQQAISMADQANIKINPALLPGTIASPPVKDLKRLSTIPITPPTRQQMIAKVSKMEVSLKKIVDPKLVVEVEKFEAGKSAQEIQRASVGGWYNDDPQAALLLGMKAAQKAPDNPANWNNLASQLTMTRMEEHAIPILQNLLEKNPNSAMVLNNMGQAYLGLGDLNKSGEFLKRCLIIDEMHPEANHSMAMISLFRKEFDKATQYFEKELQIAQRRSSIAHLGKAGLRGRLNLATLRKRKMQMDGTDKRNFFEEINLGKFSIPDLPLNTEESKHWMDAHAGFMQSLQNELFFWMNAGVLTPEQRAAEGRRRPGLYSDLVTTLLEDLGSTYAPILGLIEEQDVNHLTQMGNDFAKKLNAVVCPRPPSDPLNFAELEKAYQKKCCDLKTPIIDAFVKDYNSFISNRVQLVQTRWKEYINAMVSIVQLDPDAGNKKIVYATVANYFTFLIGCMQAAKLEPLPIECPPDMTTAQADAIIASNHNFQIDCPDWLKIDISLKIAKLKADCESFNVEADIYKIIHVGVEKKFRTGTSTLYVGAGVDGSFFKDVLSAGVTQQFYIVFDNNNEFADLGMRGSGNFDIANGLFGEEMTYDFSMNSGFSGDTITSSEWVSKFEKVLGYLPN